MSLCPSYRKIYTCSTGTAVRNDQGHKDAHQQKKKLKIKLQKNRNLMNYNEQVTTHKK